MYVNGMGFRGIERVTGVHHTTVINWVRQVGERLPLAYDPETSPQVGELDELETFVGSKKKIWLSTAVDHFKPGILGWVLGDRAWEDLCPLVGACSNMELLFLCHGRLVSLSRIYSRWRSDY
jgi:hypothetical protein